EKQRTRSDRALSRRDTLLSKSSTTARSPRSARARFPRLPIPSPRQGFSSRTQSNQACQWKAPSGEGHSVPVPVDWWMTSIQSIGFAGRCLQTSAGEAAQAKRHGRGSVWSHMPAAGCEQNKHREESARSRIDSSARTWRECLLQRTQSKSPERCRRTASLRPESTFRIPHLFDSADKV